MLPRKTSWFIMLRDTKIKQSAIKTAATIANIFLNFVGNIFPLYIVISIVLTLLKKFYS